MSDADRPERNEAIRDTSIFIGGMAFIDDRSSANDCGKEEADPASEEEAPKAARSWTRGEYWIPGNSLTNCMIRRSSQHEPRHNIIVEDARTNTVRGSSASRQSSTQSRGAGRCDGVTAHNRVHDSSSRSTVVHGHRTSSARCVNGVSNRYSAKTPPRSPRAASGHRCCCRDASIEHSRKTLPDWNWQTGQASQDQSTRRRSWSARRDQSTQTPSHSPRISLGNHCAVGSASQQRRLPPPPHRTSSLSDMQPPTVAEARTSKLYDEALQQQARRTQSAMEHHARADDARRASSVHVGKRRSLRNTDTISARLYEDAARRQRDLVAAMDKYTNLQDTSLRLPSPPKCSSQRHKQLYSDAEHRRERLKSKCEERDRTESEWTHASSMLGFPAATARTGPDYKRLDALYQDYAHRQQRLACMRAESIRDQAAAVEMACRPPECFHRLGAYPDRKTNQSPRGQPSSSSPRSRSGSSCTRAVQPVVEICDDPPGRLVALVAEIAAQAIAEKGTFCIAVSGEPVASMLGSFVEDPAVDWSRWYVCFVDERRVPHGHKDSNYGAARAAWLDNVPIPASQIIAVDEAHLLRLDCSPAEAVQIAADSYERRLRALPESVLPRRIVPGIPPGSSREMPAFDLVLLSVGTDGHIGALFPGHPLLDDSSGLWTLPVTDAPYGPLERVTVSISCLTAASKIVLVGLGAECSSVVAAAFEQPQAFDMAASSILPCSLAISMTPGTPGPTWILDKDAAAVLVQGDREATALCSPNKPAPPYRGLTPARRARPQISTRARGRQCTPPRSANLLAPRDYLLPLRKKQADFGEAVTDQSSRGRSIGQAMTSRAPIKADYDAQYILAAVADAIRLRCGYAQDDRQPRDRIRNIVAPLQDVLSIYRDALANSEPTPGCAGLVGCSSQRLYNGGYLYPEQEGWRRNLPPDPVHQIQHRLEDLLVSAAEAQDRLKMLMEPDRSWSQCNAVPRPSGVPAAIMAVDPGLKSEYAARAKARVLYPSAGSEMACRHLTDLARIKLVFETSELLILGARQLCSKFEVVSIRDNYSDPGRMGMRYVEVLVIVQVAQLGRQSVDELQPPDRIPHICEIRLEEMPFHKVQETAAPYMSELMRQCRQICSASPTDADAICYLAKSVLHGCPVSHKVRTFRNLLAKRCGSAVSVWRQHIGGRVAKFSRFRDVCNLIDQGVHAAEMWEALDSTLGGCISLFDLDPEACIALIRFRAKLLATPDSSFVGELPQGLCEQAFARLCCLAPPNVPGRLGIQEFRVAGKHLGLAAEETDRVFAHLDYHGGVKLPARICPADVGWLMRLPDILDCEAVLITTAGIGAGDDLQCAHRDTSPTRQVLHVRSGHSPCSDRDFDSCFTGDVLQLRSPRVGRPTCDAHKSAAYTWAPRPEQCSAHTRRPHVSTEPIAAGPKGGALRQLSGTRNEDVLLMPAREDVSKPPWSNAWDTSLAGLQRDASAGCTRATEPCFGSSPGGSNLPQHPPPLCNPRRHALPPAPLELPAHGVQDVPAGNEKPLDCERPFSPLFGSRASRTSPGDVAASVANVRAEAVSAESSAITATASAVASPLGALGGDVSSGPSMPPRSPASSGTDVGVNTEGNAAGPLIRLAASAEGDAEFGPRRESGSQLRGVDGVAA